MAWALRHFGLALPRLTHLWADAGYAGALEEELREQMGWEVEIVTRADDQPTGTFAVQPHRWIVERTIGWWGGFRRLTKDYEDPVESSEAMIDAGMTDLTRLRLARSEVASSPAG